MESSPTEWEEEAGGGVPSDEALFEAGWAKHFDPTRQAYYYYTLDGSSGPTWENPISYSIYNASHYNSVMMNTTSTTGFLDSVVEFSEDEFSSEESNAASISLAQLQQAQQAEEEEEHEQEQEQFSDEDVAANNSLQQQLQLAALGKSNVFTKTPVSRLARPKRKPLQAQPSQRTKLGESIVFTPDGRTTSLQIGHLSPEDVLDPSRKRPQRVPPIPVDTKDDLRKKQREYDALVKEYEPKYYFKTCGCFEVCLMVCILIGAIVSAVFVFKSALNQGRIMADSYIYYTQEQPTSAPTAQPFVVPEYTQQAMSNFNSPQATALNTLQNDPLFDTYSFGEKYKRLALLTLYYATGGPNWNTGFTLPGALNAIQTECDFPYYTCPTQYNSSSHFVSHTVNNQSQRQRQLQRQLFHANYNHGATLELVNQTLQGTLPKEMGLLTDLQYVTISNHAQLVGTIPHEIRFWSEYIFQITLSNNALTGTIPHALGQFRYLRSLWLGDNRLSSTVPFQLAQLSQLTSLQLYNNKLTGTLPSNLLDYPYLHELLLQNNLLSGPIPYLARPNRTVTRVREIALNNNQFNGTIPTFLGLLTDLQILQLHANSLTGSVPKQVCNLLQSAGRGGKLRLLTVDCLVVRCSCACTCPTGGKPRSDKILKFLPEDTVNKIENDTLNNPTPTAQNLAFKWLQDDPNYDDYSLDIQLQRFALATLYYATNHPPNYDTWRVSTHWLQYDDGGECTWASTPSVLYRIPDKETDGLPTCIPGNGSNGSPSDRYYQSLRLPNNDLVGSIPPELALLTHLKKLQLHNNTLRCTIPSTFASLTELKMLDLEASHITGTIPVQLTQLPLRKLYLGENSLTGTLPQFISQFSVLDTLQLNNNNFSSTIVSELGLLNGTLHRLYLTGNSLTGSLPLPQFPQMTSLIDLYLSENDLVDNINNLPWNSTPLEQLVISANRFSGTIPSLIGKLKYARVISLDKNEIRGSIPNEIGNLSSLQWLHLSSNLLTNTIPESMGELVQLIEFYVSDCQIRGTIPTGLGSLPLLKRLSADTNRISGRIPTQFGSSTSLSILKLDHNNMVGPVPTEFGNLKETLTWLDLSWNALTSSVPSEIGLLDRSDFVYMERNNLKGLLPSTLGLLSSAAEISFYGNQLTGSLPTELGLLSNKITGIFLHENYFKGLIPSELGYLTNLQSLWLHLNAFTGSVPKEVCQLFQTGNLKKLAVDCLKVVCSCGCTCPTEQATALQSAELRGNRYNSGSRNVTIDTTLVDSSFNDPEKRKHIDGLSQKQNIFGRA